MPPKNSGGSTKFPGGRKVINRTTQTAFVRVVTPRFISIRIHFQWSCDDTDEYVYLCSASRMWNATVNAL